MLNQTNIVSYMPTDEISVISYTFIFVSAITVNSKVGNFFLGYCTYLPDVLPCINKSDDDDDDDDGDDDDDDILTI